MGNKTESTKTGCLKTGCLGFTGCLGVIGVVVFVFIGIMMNYIPEDEKPYYESARNGDSDAQCAMGFIKLIKGDREEAKKWFGRKENSNNPIARFMLGVCYADDGYSAYAINEFRSAERAADSYFFNSSLRKYHVKYLSNYASKMCCHSNQDIQDAAEEAYLKIRINAEADNS